MVCKYFAVNYYKFVLICFISKQDTLKKKKKYLIHIFFNVKNTLWKYHNVQIHRKLLIKNKFLFKSLRF